MLCNLSLESAIKSSVRPMPRIRAPITFRDLWSRLPGWVASSAVSASRLTRWEGTQAQPHSPGTNVHDGDTELLDTGPGVLVAFPLHWIPIGSKLQAKRKGTIFCFRTHIPYRLLRVHTGPNCRLPTQPGHRIYREAGRCLLKAQKIGSGIRIWEVGF